MVLNYLNKNMKAQTVHDKIINFFRAYDDYKADKTL